MYYLLIAFRNVESYLKIFVRFKIIISVYRRRDTAIIHISRNMHKSIVLTANLK